MLMRVMWRPGVKHVWELNENFQELGTAQGCSPCRKITIRLLLNHPLGWLCRGEGENMGNGKAGYDYALRVGIWLSPIKSHFKLSMDIPKINDRGIKLSPNYQAWEVATLS